MELEKSSFNIKGEKYSVWVVAAPFCAMRYSNSPRYLEEGKKSGKLRNRTEIAKCAV